MPGMPGPKGHRVKSDVISNNIMYIKKFGLAGE